MLSKYNRTPTLIRHSTLPPGLTTLKARGLHAMLLRRTASSTTSPSTPIDVAKPIRTWHNTSRSSRESVNRCAAATLSDRKRGARAAANHRLCRRSARMAAALRNPRKDPRRTDPYDAHRRCHWPEAGRMGTNPEDVLLCMDRRKTRVRCTADRRVAARNGRQAHGRSVTGNGPQRRANGDGRGGSARYARLAAQSRRATVDRSRPGPILHVAGVTWIGMEVGRLSDV
ncbi:hypothetical protein BD414DRAFT_147563 [Trametes punicea]|nr:hypothetical protein BD414DRAFT_147563 [Trametes punicea]